MADPNRPGVETSEHAALKQAQVWIRFAAGVIVAVASGLLATGVIPGESAWASMLSILVAVATAIGGEVIAAKNYTQARTALKIAQLAGGKPENPPTT